MPLSIRADVLRPLLTVGFPNTVSFSTDGSYIEG